MSLFEVPSIYITALFLMSHMARLTVFALHSDANPQVLADSVSV